MGTRAICSVPSALVLLAISTSSLVAQPASGNTMQASCGKPDGGIFEKGVIPDTKTASAVALQILNSIYGPKVIGHQLPLSVEEKADKYIINGVMPKYSIGGNATIVLCRSNGAVLYLYHSK